ncbi:MAG: dipeptidyl-peptidase 3 family protein [Steroidobacteraceae bacterium]
MTLAVTGAAGAAAVPVQPAAQATPAVVPARPGIYAPFTLQSDLAWLTADERRMLGLFIDAADVMDGLFWKQAYGDRDALLKSLAGDADAQRFAKMNYGPWDRLADNAPFVPGAGAKPAGAQFYPHDMTKEEFERADLPGSRSEYTVLRRDAKGALRTVPYHVEYPSEVERAAVLLDQAAALATDPGLRRYLELRAKALRTDQYRDSDRAWLDMKDNRIDVVIGPIETYEDQLFGYKAAYEAYVLVKDMEWSKRLARYAAMLPELQRGLPVPDAYKAEQPGTDSDLNAYDVLYYAGDSNSGSKTIAINLPNDEQVQLEKGTRRLQLKNAMRAKFDAIMVPIADELIVPEQRKHVTFDAFFGTTMFHEVAHGLGIKNTLDGKGTVRDALKELGSGLEEGKADILGLYMITRLHEKGEVSGSLEDYYVTFMTGIFRSVRFGAASAHGRANMLRFNFFADRGAFTRNADGRYRVDMDKTRKAMDELSALILKLQGDGDYAGVKQLGDDLGVIRPDLAADLARLSARNIPVDVTFNQGKAVLGLK